MVIRFRKRSTYVPFPKRNNIKYLEKLFFRFAYMYKYLHIRDQGFGYNLGQIQQRKDMLHDQCSLWLPTQYSPLSI